MKQNTWKADTRGYRLELGVAPRRVKSKGGGRGLTKPLGLEPVRVRGPPGRDREGES